MSNADTAAAASTTWSSSFKDKYRRTCKMLRNAECCELAVMVTLPKVCFEATGMRYMVTDRRLGAFQAAQANGTAWTWDFATRKEAIAFAESHFSA